MRAVAIALVLGLVLGVSVRAEEWPDLDSLAIASLQLSALPSRGTPGKLRIVEVTDFGCPACIKAHPVVEELLGLYRDRIELHFLAIAGPSHPWSRDAYAAARCVSEDDPAKFWSAATYFYEHAREIDVGTVGEASRQLAAKLEAAGEAFETCYDADKYREEIDANLQAVLAVGVRATPTFIIAGKMIPGGRSLEELRAIVDEALAVEGGGFFDWFK